MVFTFAGILVMGGVVAILGMIFFSCMLLASALTALYRRFFRK